ncbi:hypothetical protein J6590_061110 [Homalodisca vitripennis]|nr:hypothetical protein J6590_061110 [Homalodisca vitripennis]
MGRFLSKSLLFLGFLQWSHNFDLLIAVFLRLWPKYLKRNTASIKLSRDIFSSFPAVGSPTSSPAERDCGRDISLGAAGGAISNRFRLDCSHRVSFAQSAALCGRGQQSGPCPNLTRSCPSAGRNTELFPFPGPEFSHPYYNAADACTPRNALLVVVALPALQPITASSDSEDRRLNISAERKKTDYSHLFAVQSVFDLKGNGSQCIDPAHPSLTLRLLGGGGEGKRQLTETSGLAS